MSVDGPVIVENVMLNGDWLTPLAAGVICREIDLPPEESIALTAAALVLNGPLALAPVLVAVERERSRNASLLDSSKLPIGPPLVQIPDVVGQPEKEALRLLAAASLRGEVISRNRSSDLQKGKVIAQHESGPTGRLVEQGTVVALRIGAGDAAQALPDENATIASLHKELRSWCDKMRTLTSTLARSPTHVRSD